MNKSYAILYSSPTQSLFLEPKMELFPTVYRESCIISQKLPDSGTHMGTMESLPQEFHQAIACNAKHKHIKDAAADTKPLRGQTKIVTAA